MDIQTLEDERRRAIQAQGDLRMGVSGGWNVAGRNMRSSPYADFEPYDDGYDDPEDYRGEPMFHFPEGGGQGEFLFPFVQAPQKQNGMMIANARLPFINIDNLEDPVGTLRDGGYPDPDVMDFPSGGNYRKGSDVLDKLIDLELVKQNPNNMMIAGAQDLDTKQLLLRNGMFVDENQIKYMWSPREQKFIDMGPYDPYYDGLPIPLGQRNTDMKIAKKNKRKSQRAYEDFVKDSGSQPLDEQLMDMDRGRMGGGLDILDRLFPRA